MCLIINPSYHPLTAVSKGAPYGWPRPLVAERDLFVFKAVKAYYHYPIDRRPSPAYCTIFRGATVKLGNIYTASFGIDRPLWLGGSLFTVSKGLHAYTMEALPYLFEAEDCTLLLAIIPKGTLYYIGKDNDIVSKRMVYVRDLIGGSNGINIAKLKKIKIILLMKNLFQLGKFRVVPR